MLLTAASEPSGQPLWQVFAVASVPGLAAVIAAVIAGLYARSSKVSEHEAQRVRDLESRIADRKYETYRPMIILIGDMLDSRKVAELGDTIPDRLREFATWASIYASDEAFRAFRNLMQASFAGSPAPILLRLYAEFVLTARRDIGRSDTTTTAEDVLGVRITDIYASDGLLWAVREPFEEVCRRVDWTPPWSMSEHG
ncbi:hypothetical protein ACIBMZ_05810 [Micromonospora sp. NPDC049900]|uniref:hypothetical protein n=1 Tax=Micromonospora sp. NPDC049900 TaxID=3364275 RepID=UPI0037A0D0C0